MSSRARQQSVEVLAAVAAFAALGGLFAQLITSLVGGLFAPANLLLTALYALLSLLVWVLVRRDQIGIGTTLLVLLLVVSFLVVTFRPVELLLALLAVVGSSLLQRRVTYLLALTIILMKLLADFLNVALANGFVVSDEGLMLSIQMSVLVIISIILRYFVFTAERTTSEAQRAADLLRAAAEIGQATSSLQELDRLFADSIDLIRTRFGYYHVQIFLVDEAREFAVLQASTGQIGQQLLERGHKLAIGSQSVIGRVTQMGEPVITTSADSVYAPNDLLPSTRAELAVPIMDGQSIIGALDVQSTQRDAFDNTAIRALQIMANQLGISIRNSRLYQAELENVRRSKELFLREQASSREVDRLNRQLTRKAWQDYLTTQTEPLDGVTFSAAEGVQESATWTADMVQAARNQRPMPRRTADGRQVVAVPIVLRGAVIGAIEVESENNITEAETVELIDAVAQRLAVSLDNARLFEEAQKAARQEQRLNEISGQYQEAAHVDDLLQITLKELRDTLGARQGMIRLGTPKHQNGSNGA